MSGNELCLMTSHLESTRGHAKERMNQLKMVLERENREREREIVDFVMGNLIDGDIYHCVRNGERID